MAGQGDVANAKDDTRFLAVGASITALTTDLSQYADNLTAGTGCVHENDAARWSEATPPLALEMLITANSTDTGYLYTHESAAAGLRISVAAGPIIEIRVNNGLATGSLTLTGIAGTRESLLVRWSIEANVFTTGAANAYRSNLSVWNITDGTYFKTTATHVVPVDATGSAIFGARTTAGSAAYTGDITAVRWSVGRYHPAAEAREDFIATTSAPTLAFESRLEVPVPTRASGAGDDGMFAGPVFMAAAASLRLADIRQASPQLAETYRDTPTQDTSPPAVRQWLDPDGSGLWFLGQHLEHRAVPRTTNRLHVRLHVQAWRVDASGPDDVVVRVYSMSRPPGPGMVNGPPASPWVKFYQEVTINSADGSGTTGGAWYSLDPLRIARDPSHDGTWLAIAVHVVDANGGGIADQRWRVRAWSVEPGVIDSSGELPLGGLA
jgi:hypothetical protein